MINDTLYPLIPFNVLVDTDVGLIKTINKKYHKKDLFYTGILSAPTKQLIYLLQTRKDTNPLSIVMKNTEDKKTMELYYNQFITEDYDSVLSNSVTTDMFTAVEYFLDNGIALPTILCKNESEVNIISRLSIGQTVKTVVGSFNDIDISEYDPVYVKDVTDCLPIENKIYGKNVYISSVSYNFINDLPEGISDDGLVIREDVGPNIIEKCKVTIYQMYKMDNSYKSEG